MALPSGPLNEPQHRMWYSSQENSGLVLSRQHLPGVEVIGIVSLGPRKTFAPPSFQLGLPLIPSCIIAGSGKSVMWFVDYQ